MRMRVGDIEMDSSSGMSFGPPEPEVLPVAQAATKSELVRDVVAVPQPVFLIAAFFAVLASMGLGAVVAVYGLWLLLIPIPFLLRFAGYAAILGTRKRTSSKRAPLTLTARNAVLSALEERPMTVDELADGLGWSEAQTLEAVVRLIEQKEVEEDLEIESGDWRYRRVVQFGTAPERTALPATERLEAVQAAQPMRRKS